MAKREFIRLPGLDEGEVIFLSPSRIQAVEHVPGARTTIKMNTHAFEYNYGEKQADQVFQILQGHIDPDFIPSIPLPGGGR